MELLVVDDEGTVLGLCRRGLQGKDFNVTTVSSAEEALLALSNKSFDILLTDLQMEPTGGISLIESVRAGFPDTDILVMTGYATLDTVVRAFKLGVYDYIIKPLDLFLLKAALKRCAEHRQLKARITQKSGTAAEVSNSLTELSLRLRALAQPPEAKPFEAEHKTCQEIVEKALARLKSIQE